MKTFTESSMPQNRPVFSYGGRFFSVATSLVLLCFSLIFSFSAAHAQVVQQWQVGPLSANHTEYYIAHVLDADQNILVLGRSGTLQFGTGLPSDTRITLYKINPAGEVLLAKVLDLKNGSAWDIPRTMLLDAEGNLLITGTTHMGVATAHSFIAKISGAGNLLWLVQREATTIKDMDLATDGSIYFVETTLESEKSCLKTTKLSASGAEVWSTKFFGTDGAGAQAFTVKADNKGNVYVASSFDKRAEPFYPADEDVTLVKYSAATGEQLFMRNYNSSESMFLYEFERPVKLLSTEAGNIYLVSQQNNELQSSQVRVYKVSSSGDLMWQQAVGQYVDISLNSTVAGFYAAVVSPDESIVLTGVDIKYRNLRDHFVTKFNGEGDRMWYHNLNENGTYLRFNSLLNVAVSDNGTVALTGHTQLMQVINAFPPFIIDIEHPSLKTVLYDAQGQVVYQDVKPNNASVYTFGAAVAFLANNDFYVLNSVADKTSDGSASQLFARRYSTGCASNAVASAGPDQHTCNGKAVTLKASGGVSYSWSPATGLSNPNAAETTANPSQTTTYTVAIKDQCGNTSTDEVTVHVGVKEVDVKLYLPPMAKRVGWQVRTTADFGSHTLNQDTGVRWTWDDGSQHSVSYTAYGTPRITGEHTYTKAGIYTIGLNFDESCLKPNADDFTQQIVIYDPEAGYVTGEGTIKNANVAMQYMERNRMSAYTFSINYPSQWSTTPNGSMQLMLNNNSDKFSSTALDWLVISGNRAAWQGWGTLNGSGKYKFVATLEDGGRQGKNDPFDRLRVQIWSQAGKLVYDNFAEGAMRLSLQQPLPKIITGQVMINGQATPMPQVAAAANIAVTLEPEAATAMAYPNPFTERVILRFTTGASGPFQVALYDARGSLVRQLKAGEAEAGALVEVEVSGHELPEGVYFAHLMSNKTAQTIKLVRHR